MNELRELAGKAEVEPVTWGDVRGVLNRYAKANGEWAGIPLAVAGLRLTVEPKYPWQNLQGATLGEGPAELPEDCTIVNSWVSLERGCRVYVVRDKVSGKSFAVRTPLVGGERLTMQIQTLGALAAWDVAAEMRAVGKLRAMLANNPSMFDAYVLTGMFLETSKRSGVTYLFRRLRPTVALASGEQVKVLAALCLHPIGYYQGTFAGVMVPTDDVIAHLALMRADERRFWGMANHHAMWDPEAGI